MNRQIKQKAVHFCIKNKHRLTRPRLIVLQIIASSKKPIKAYEILKKLSLKIPDPHPPTAYRAIEFWKKYNFIHRIESLNAYTICKADHFHEGSQFLICDNCGRVIESHFCELPSIIKKNIIKNTFIASKWNLEINGLCGNCS